jgi:hypothetical protein
MRVAPVILAAVMLGGCSSSAALGSVERTGSSSPTVATPEPSAPVPVDSPAITAASSESPLVHQAIRWAESAGFEVDAASVTQDIESPFDSLANQRVLLTLEGESEGALAVYFDQAGVIRAAEGGSSGGVTDAVSADEIASIAVGLFTGFGIDSESGTLHVEQPDGTSVWMVTLDRKIDGVLVSNPPMVWGLAGDKVYALLRADGSFLQVYAVQLGHLAAPPALDTATLNARLAEFAELSETNLKDLGPALAWLRARDPATGDIRDVLSLNYCATQRTEQSWQTWCVDAGSGDPSAAGRAVD